MFGSGCTKPDSQARPRNFHPKASARDILSSNSSSFIVLESGLPGWVSDLPPPGLPKPTSANPRSVLGNKDRKRTRPGVIRTHDQGILRTKAHLDQVGEKPCVFRFRPCKRAVSSKVGQSQNRLGIVCKSSQFARYGVNPITASEALPLLLLLKTPLVRSLGGLG